MRARFISAVPYIVAATPLVPALLGIALVLCGCIPVEDAPAAMLPPEETVATEHANGMPLDAISYDPPAWMPGCYEAYRIYDRTNGQQWWALAIDDHYGSDTDWIVLPIGYSHDTL